jgi:hypothetical protein
MISASQLLCTRGIVHRFGFVRKKSSGHPGENSRQNRVLRTQNQEGTVFWEVLRQAAARSRKKEPEPISWVDSTRFIAGLCCGISATELLEETRCSKARAGLGLGFFVHRKAPTHSCVVTETHLSCAQGTLFLSSINKGPHASNRV